MARLMWICGILLFAAGVALGVILLVSAERPGGIDIHTAVTLLVGGILALGLGGVIDALAAGRPVIAVEENVVAVAPAATAAPIPQFDPRSAKAAPAAETAEAAAEEEVSRPTRDTIQALEQARQKIEQAFDARSTSTAVAVTAEVAGAESVAKAEEADAEDDSEPEEAAEDEAVAEDEAMDDGQLYVVEERVIRRHPARILSDGTVEAETSEGWMRFENLEHLDEYLDAMETARG